MIEIGEYQINNDCIFYTNLESHVMKMKSNAEKISIHLVKKIFSGEVIK